MARMSLETTAKDRKIRSRTENKIRRTLPETIIAITADRINDRGIIVCWNYISSMHFFISFVSCISFRITVSID